MAPYPTALPHGRQAWLVAAAAIVAMLLAVAATACTPRLIKPATINESQIPEDYRVTLRPDMSDLHYHAYELGEDYWMVACTYTYTRTTPEPLAMRAFAVHGGRVGGGGGGLMTEFDPKRPFLATTGRGGVPRADIEDAEEPLLTASGYCLDPRVIEIRGRTTLGVEVSGAVHNGFWFVASSARLLTEPPFGMETWSEITALDAKGKALYREVFQKP